MPHVGPDSRAWLRALPGTPWTSVLLTLRDRRIDLRADGGVLLASGHLAHAPAEPLDRLEAIRDALLASRGRDALARAAVAWALADRPVAEAGGGSGSGPTDT